MVGKGASRRNLLWALDAGSNCRPAAARGPLSQPAQVAAGEAAARAPAVQSKQDTECACTGTITLREVQHAPCLSSAASARAMSAPLAMLTNSSGAVSGATAGWVPMSSGHGVDMEYVQIPSEPMQCHAAALATHAAHHAAAGTPPPAGAPESSGPRRPAADGPLASGAPPEAHHCSHGEGCAVSPCPSRP